MYIFANDANDPDDVKRKRELSALLQQRATSDYNPNATVFDALASALNGFGAYRKGKEADTIEGAGRASGNELVKRLLGGSQPQNDPAAPQPTQETSVTGGYGIQAFGAGKPKTDWLQYDNTNAIRNKPISGDLQNSLSFLPEMGVTMKVFSGGQDDSRRTGSKRHDHGNSADVFFYKDGRKLDWRNQSDIPVLQSIVSRAKNNGVTGFGAGEGYMQPGSMHVGFGTPAVWGSGGKGENAPGWLKQAFHGGATPQVQPAGGQEQPQQAPQQASLQQLQSAIMSPQFKWVDPQMQQMIIGQYEFALKNSQPMGEADKLDLEMKRIDLEQKRNPQMTPYQQEQLNLDQQRARQPVVLGEGSRVYDPQTGKITVDQAARQTPKPAEIAEYEYAKGQGFAGSFMDYQSSKKGGMQLSVDPSTGQVSFQQGSNIKPMTEAQSKDTVFATRAQGALEVFDPIAGALTEYQGATFGNVPVLGNAVKGEKYQEAEQAGNEFLQAMLRKDTGAAITPGEQSLYGKTYLPQPGDGEGVLMQKKASRRRALEGIMAGMTPQSILAKERALKNTNDAAANVPVTKASDGSILTGPAGTFAMPVPKAAQDQGWGEEFNFLTPEEQKKVLGQ